MYYYKTTLAGINISYAFRHLKTALCFGKWISKGEKTDSSIIIPENAILNWQTKWGFPDNESTEFGLSVFYTSDELLKNNCCVFHAAAFLLNGKAYLLSAASGVGKSTQLENLHNLYPDEIKIMNGDKPILVSDKNRRVIVYPSPWKGKEKWGDDTITAPLGGVIILKQGKENVLRRATTREAVPFLLSRFLFTVGNRDAVYLASSIEETLITTVPVWIFKNTGHTEGSKILYEMLKSDGGL